MVGRIVSTIALGISLLLRSRLRLVVRTLIARRRRAPVRPSASAPASQPLGAPAPGRARARARISTPIVISAYSVGWWNSGRTLSISVRKRAASSVPTNDPRPPARLAPPSTAGGDALQRLVADDRRPDLHLGGEVEAADRGQHGAGDEREDHDDIGADPEPARRRLVEADCAQRHARARAVEPAVRRDREERRRRRTRSGRSSSSSSARRSRCSRSIPDGMVAQPERMHPGGC